MPKGGFRPGAGRPKGSRTVTLAADPQRAAAPLAYLLAVMSDPAADPARRDRAAIAALPYLHPRADAGGKKAGAAIAPERAKAGTEWERLLS